MGSIKDVAVNHQLDDKNLSSKILLSSGTSEKDLFIPTSHLVIDLMR